MSWDLQGSHGDNALYTSILVPMRPAPGKVSRTEQLPPRAATARAATDTAAPVQAFGGTFSLDAAFAPHLDAPPPVQCDGGVGAAGDRYEAHADAVADAVVRGESAAALLDAGADGAPAVQRDPLTPDARRAAQAHVVSDLVMEQIAHRIAYSDGRPPHDEGSTHAHTGLRAARAGMSDAAPHLDGAGHTDDEVALSDLGFAIDQFQYFSGEGGLQFWILPAQPGATVTPVIAFRGTEMGLDGEGAEDLGEDVNGAGVGMAQFTMNQGAIHAALTRLGGHGVVATGHSLGGALAQIAACMYPELIVSVITFQAPGIPASVVSRIRDLPRDERVAARHHRVDGCVVDGAGEDFVPGDVEIYGEGTVTSMIPLVGAVDDHRTFPVLAGAEASGEAEPWMEGRVNPDLAAGPRHSVTTDDSAGRELAIGGLSEGARGLVDTWVREAYSNIWMEVFPYAEHGYHTFESIKTTILTRCRAERIPSYAGRMRTNLGQLYPEYPVTDEVVRAGGDAVASIAAFLAAVGARVPLDDDRRLRVRNIYLSHGFTIAEGTDPVFGDGGLGDARDIHAHAARGVSGSGGVLPHLEAIQHSFGHHDVSGVRAHVGGVAAEASHAIGAAAYATGDDVAFAGAPDLRQAAHEAAHVVQQRGGVRLDGGVGRAGDPYERHADDVAALVTRGESAEALLDTMAHRGASGGAAVQREVFPDENGAILRDHVAGLTAVPTLRRQLVELRTALAGASGPVLVTVRLVGRTEEVRVASVTVRTIATQLESRIASMGGAEDGPDAAPAGIDPAAPRTRASAPDTGAPRARTGAGSGGHRERPLAEVEAHVTRERELIQARFPAPFGPIEVSATLAASAEVGPPAAESEGGHPPPGRVTLDTVESTDESGATTRHISVEGEGLLRRMLDNDLAGCSDHFEISPEHDGLHFNAGLNLPEAQVGPIHLQFAIDLIDYDPGATGRSALTILSPSATASVPLSIEARTALGLDVGAHAELEIRAQYYPQADQILAALQRQFAPYFASLSAEAGAGAAAAAEVGVGGEVAEGGAVVAEGGFLGTLATIGAVILGFGAIFATDGSTAEGERMAQQIAIYEYGQEFADVITGTVGEHDATPSEAVHRARAQARSDAGRATADQRRQLATAGYAAISLAASRAQAERQGTTFEATWFD